MIRPRQPGDLPTLVQVLREVHKVDRYPSSWPHDPLAFVAMDTPLSAWVAEVGGQVVGQVLLCEVQSGSDWGGAAGGDLAEIKRLFVAPAARGLGLAGQLLRAALAGAASRHRRAVLETRADNQAANRLYQRGGWQRAGVVRAVWTDETGQHPLMQRYTAP